MVVQSYLINELLKPLKAVEAGVIKVKAVLVITLIKTLDWNSSTTTSVYYMVAITPISVH